MLTCTWYCNLLWHMSTRVKLNHILCSFKAPLCFQNQHTHTFMAWKLPFSTLKYSFTYTHTHTEELEFSHSTFINLIKISLLFFLLSSHSLNKIHRTLCYFAINWLFLLTLFDFDANFLLCDVDREPRLCKLNRRVERKWFCVDSLSKPSSIFFLTHL